MKKTEQDNMPHRAGFVAIMGKPNVGKSTIVNALVGQKVSIVSSKPETTRRRALGITNAENAQIILVDTPGIRKPEHRLGHVMNEAARNALIDADAVIFVADVSRLPNKDDERIAQMINRQEKIPVVLALNKMDKLPPERVNTNVEAYCSLLPNSEYMLTTATKGHNLTKLINLLIPLLPESPPLYPEDQVTDQPSRLFAAELVREQVLKATHKEVPYVVSVSTDNWEERDNGMTVISATIYVEKDGQKAIIIGKNGQMLKHIGEKARMEIEKELEIRVYLDLWVKVREDWRQNDAALRSMEYSG